MTDVNLKFYSDISYHNEVLKSLIRYRFDKVKEHFALKISIYCLVHIIFLESKKLVLVLHCSSVYSILYEFPGAKQVAAGHLTRLCNLLKKITKKIPPLLFEKQQEITSDQICPQNLWN